MLKENVIVGAAAAPYAGRLLTRKTEGDFVQWIISRPSDNPSAFQTQKRVFFLGFTRITASFLQCNKFRHIISFVFFSNL